MEKGVEIRFKGNRAGKKEFIEGREEGRIKGMQEKLENIVKTMDKKWF